MFWAGLAGENRLARPLMAPNPVKRGPTKKNAVINYCVILSYYTIDDCGSVIRGPSRLSNVSKILL